LAKKSGRSPFVFAVVFWMEPTFPHPLRYHSTVLTIGSFFSLCSGYSLPIQAERKGEEIGRLQKAWTSSNIWSLRSFVL
jgi:hypothetical protein